MGVLTKFEAFRDAVMFQDNWRAAGLQSRPSVAYAQALYAQAAHETGNFKSNICVNGLNLFGMKQARKRPKLWIGEISGHAKYSSELDSLIDRMNWDAWHRINFQNFHDWIRQVQNKGYAENPLYVKLVTKHYDQLFNTSNGGYVEKIDSKPQTWLDKISMIAVIVVTGIFLIKR